MVNVELNAWSKLPFHDPEDVLKKLRQVQIHIASQIADDKKENLRTPQLKAEREAWDAAVFAYGMGQALGQKVLLARHEASDYDFVTCWSNGNELSFCPVQLKELVPQELNATASIADLLEKLAKPSTKSDTVLAVKLNREIRFEYPVDVPGGLPFSQLWFFGGTSPDQNGWFLYGDAFADPIFFEFTYPQW